jgi:hypothetical protein
MSIYVPHLDQWIAYYQWLGMFWAVWIANLVFWISDEL